MTVVEGKTTFWFVLAKGPKRRKSRSGSDAGTKARSEARGNRVEFDSRIGGSSPSNRSTSAQTGTRKAFLREREEREERGERESHRQFVLYVEGARDREILECWARRIDMALARCIEGNTVILGGRRPARAVADFRTRGGVEAGHAGLIVLDRDDHGPIDPGTSPGTSHSRAKGSRHGPEPVDPEGASDTIRVEDGLEVFIWSLRHIESYLLVPAAIRRMLGLSADDRRVERSIEASIGATTPYASASSHRLPHAKRILGSGGSLSEALGTELRAGDIARAMRIEDLHGDVHMLFDRIGALSGHSVRHPEVVFRS